MREDSEQLGHNLVIENHAVDDDDDDDDADADADADADDDVPLCSLLPSASGFGMD